MIEELFRPDFWQNIIEQYRDIGPIIAIFLCFIESFLPILPLLAFVTLNVYVFGSVMGFIYSLIGSITGSILVFLFFRKFVQRWFMRHFLKYEKIKKGIAWVEKKGIGPLIVILSFPFTPSSFVNVIAGVSNLSIKLYIIGLLLGKTVMILLLTYIGYSISSFLEKPLQTLIGLVLIVFVWFIGKMIEKHYDL